MLNSHIYIRLSVIGMSMLGITRSKLKNMRIPLFLPTLQEVNEIMTEVAQNEVIFTVSLRRLNDGYTLTIQDIVNKGILGEITFVRVRLSHNGLLPTGYLIISLV